MMKIMFLLLIDDEFMIICYECCWVYYGDDNSCILGVGKCVVVVNGLKVERFDFDEFECINEVVMIN